MAKRDYEVIVGNIGTVYEGHNKAAALRYYETYVKHSKEQYGRASNEPVTVMMDGDIMVEYFPPTTEDDDNGEE